MSAPVALVTGAAGGIGRPLCQALSAEGFRVAAVDREGAGDGAAFFPVDLADSDGPRNAVDAVNRAFGRLDLVVHAAGLFESCATEDVGVEAWDRMMAINLRAGFFLAQAALPVLQGNAGSVVFISSVAGFYPRRDQAAYCVSKAGLEHLARVLALDFADRNVRVNVVRPGVVETGMARESYGMEGLARWAASVPMQRLAQSSDIADAVIYLAKARHVTGHVLTVDGGQTINFVRAG
ncbi:MAG: SDR family oxidoreductase [Alphaproteobacteria bacterium]|nr:SDR family oxidoreductase [Alphaproteobacteria bacterium]